MAIDAVLITHLHADHYADLGYLILARWFRGNNHPLNIYGPKGIKRIVGLWMKLNAYNIEMRRKAHPARQTPRIIEHEREAPILLKKRIDTSDFHDKLKLKYR